MRCIDDTIVNIMFPFKYNAKLLDNAMVLSRGTFRITWNQVSTSWHFVKQLNMEIIYLEVNLEGIIIYVWF